MAKTMSHNGLITIDGATIPLVNIPNVFTGNNKAYSFTSHGNLTPYYEFDWLVTQIARDIKTANDEEFNHLVALVKKELALRNLKKID